MALETWFTSVIYFYTLGVLMEYRYQYSYHLLVGFVVFENCGSGPEHLSNLLTEL